MRPALPARTRGGRRSLAELLLVLALLTVGGATTAVRAQEGASRSQAIPVQLPADTIIRPPGERFPILIRTAFGSRVLAAIAPTGAPATPAWRSDTVTAAPDVRIAWDLRDAEGRWIPSGRYTLTVHSADGTGASAEVALEIERLAADTMALPLAPRPRDLLPETVQIRQTSPWAIFIGAAAGLLPGLYGRSELNENRGGDPKTWLVVGVVTAVGFAAIVAGHRAAYSPENAAANAAARADFRLRLADAEEANARARDEARYWIRRVAAAP